MSGTLAFKPQQPLPSTFSREVKFSVEKVDLENRTIKGVVLAQVGEAKGHGVHIEESFLTDFANYVQNDLDGTLRSNFNHNWDNLGYQLGRFSSVIKTGSKLIGTLKVFESADESPRAQNMGTWFLKMAQEDPGSIMCSIRFVPEYYYQYDKDGNEVIMENYDWWTGQFENQNPQEKVFVKFGEALSCDVVAEGALTESLYHRKSNLMATEKESFFTQIMNKINELSAKVTRFTSEEETEEQETQETKETEEQEEETQETQDQGVTQEEMSKLTKSLKALEQKLEDFMNDAADQHTRGGKREEDTHEEEGFVSTHPATQRAMQIHAARKRRKSTQQ